MGITHRVFEAVFTDWTPPTDRFGRFDVACLLIELKREPPLKRLTATLSIQYPIAHSEDLGQHGNDHGVQPH